MAARKVNTPGATEKAPAADTTAQPTTAEQAEAALEHITGDNTPVGANESDPAGENTSGEKTAASPEPTAEELAAKKEYEEFLQWRKTKGESAQPATQNAPTSDAPTGKRTRQVVGPNGWITEEY